MRALVISPQAGMGNRIRAVCSALLLGKFLQRKVYHAWLPEQEERLSNIPNVRAMQQLSLENLFITDKIPVWPDSEPIQTCFSEWLPHHYWYATQSSAYHRFGGQLPLNAIGQDATELIACSAEVILVETSHILILPEHRDSWEALMTQCYQENFKPQPKYAQFLTQSFDIGISIRRGILLDCYPEARQDPVELGRWLRIVCSKRNFVLFSDDLSLRDKLREELGSGSGLLEQELLDWERGFVEFLTLALCCKKLYGTPKSSFAAQAAIFGGIPYQELLEPLKRRTLVLYAYSSTPDTLPVLTSFTEKGLSERDQIEYWLIINGERPPLSLEAWDKVIVRQSRSCDFEAWREGFRRCKLDSYDYFLCLNDSIQGPYGERNWVHKFTTLVTPTCLLSGITINCCTYQPYTLRHEETVLPHVQTMLWCTNRKGLSIVWDLLMQDSSLNEEEVIIQKQLGLSHTLLKAGYNITAIVRSDQRDYRKYENWLAYSQENTTSWCGDPWYNCRYYGKNLDPLETVFFRRHRYIDVSLD